MHITSMFSEYFLNLLELSGIHEQTQARCLCNARLRLPLESLDGSDCCRTNIFEIEAGMSCSVLWQEALLDVFLTCVLIYGSSHFQRHWSDQFSAGSGPMLRRKPTNPHSIIAAAPVCTCHVLGTLQQHRANSLW